MGKLGMNDLCFCGSKKKYKKCCLSSMRTLELDKINKFNNGHKYSSENMTLCAEYFAEIYPDHKVIDISNYLTIDTYKPYQINHYTNKTIMLVERNSVNQYVFDSKGISLTSEGKPIDMMMMYRGSYRLFSFDDILNITDSIDKMIQARLVGKNDI